MQKERAMFTGVSAAAGIADDVDGEKVFALRENAILIRIHHRPLLEERECRTQLVEKIRINSLR